MAEFTDVMIHKHQMCEYYHHDICIGCPLDSENTGVSGCGYFIETNPVYAERLILEWKKESIKWDTISPNTLLTVVSDDNVTHVNFAKYENDVIYIFDDDEMIPIDESDVIRVTPNISEKEINYYESY